MACTHRTLKPSSDVPAALDAALAAINEDGVFALIHLIVERRVKAY